MRPAPCLSRACCAPIKPTIKIEPQIKTITQQLPKSTIYIGRPKIYNTLVTQSRWNVIKSSPTSFRRTFSTYKEMTEEQLREEYEKALEKGQAEALKVLKEIVQERPDSHNAADALIVHMLEANQVDEAINLCNAQIVSNPKRFHPYNNKGEALLRKNQPREAIACFELAEKIGAEPGHMLSMIHNKTRALMAIGDYDQAIRLQQKALEMDPQSIEAVVNITTLYIYQGKKQEAVASYLGYVERQKKDPKPVDSDFLFHLAKVAHTLKFYPDAISMAETILATQAKANKPQDPNVRFTLAKFLWTANKYKESMEQLKKLINDTPTETFFWALAAAFDDTGMREEAIGSLNSMRETLKPNERNMAMIYDIHARLARLYQTKMKEKPLTDEEMKNYIDVLNALTGYCKTLKLDGKKNLTTNPKVGDEINLPLVPWFTVV